MTNKNLNEQFQELVEMIDQQRNPSALDSFKEFERFFQRRSKKISTKTKGLILSILVLVVAIGIAYSQSSDQFLYDIYFFFLSVGRILIIKILPYWDWTQLHSKQCFIANPFFNGSIDINECSKCENITKVERQSNLTFFDFTKNIYLNQLPVIIEDATESWSAINELTVEKLFRLYIDDPVLSEHDLCHFQSNIRQYNRPGGADQLFEDYLRGKRRSFVVHWNNCKRETLKVIRSFYSKPYFLPPSIGQTLMENWFLVSVGFDKASTRLHRIPGNSGWSWLAPIRGRTMIHLQPQPPCDQLCSSLPPIKLNTGDMIIYSRLYNASYTPLSKETVVLVQGFE